MKVSSKMTTITTENRTKKQDTVKYSDVPYNAKNQIDSVDN